MIEREPTELNHAMNEIRSSVVHLLMEAGLDAMDAGRFADRIVRECLRWRPIEEAPKIESILLWLPDADRGLPGCEVGQDWGEDDRCWWTNGGPNAGEDVYYEPTHYMPLPPPPQDES